MRRPVDLAAQEEALHEVLEAADEEHPTVELRVQVEVVEVPVPVLSLTWLTSRRPRVGGQSLGEVVPVSLVPV